MKPSYWQPGFGNDWLTDLFEIESVRVDELNLFVFSPGFLWLIFGIGFYLAFVIWRRWQLWRQAQFKREALILLNEAIQEQQLQSVNSILKRCVLHLLVRNEVAGLSGRPWLRRLNKLVEKDTQDDVSFSELELEKIESWAYAKPVFKDDVKPLLVKIKQWLSCLPVESNGSWAASRDVTSRVAIDDSV